MAKTLIKTKKRKKIEAASYWLDRDFDTEFRVGNTIDFSKLAAAQRAIGNFVNIVTGQQIPVQFQSNDSSFTDGKSVTIGTKLDGTNFDPAVGLALHEGSHIAYTDFTLFKGSSSLSGGMFGAAVRLRGLDPDCTMTERQFGIIKDLLNWVEDRRIDFKVYTQAPGYRGYYEAMYDKYFNDAVIDKALANNVKTDETLDSYLFHIINFTNPNRNLNALSKLKEIWDLIDLSNISRLNTTLDALDVACDIYKLLQPIIQQEDAASVQKVFDQHMDGNGADSEEGEGNGESVLDGDFETNPNQPDDISLTPREMAKLEKTIEAQKDFIRDRMKKTGKLTRTQAKLVKAMRESGTETRDVATDEAGESGIVSTIVIKKLTPGVIESIPNLFARDSNDHLKHNGKLSDYHPISQMKIAVDRGLILGRQLGSKLQLRNTERTLKSTRLAAGKIDRRLISQIGYDNVNVFHRIVTDKFKDYFIHISIDASGSMSGKKLQKSITSAVAIAQAASMTTGIRVQISFRGTDSSLNGKEQCVTIYAYDSATDKIAKIRSLFKYIDYFGCTPEGISFKSILPDLKRDARGDELIFINYSDGAPTNITGAARNYDGVKFSRMVVNDMRSLDINVISYFIYDHNIYESDREAFKTIYGPDAQFIRPDSMTDISKTINTKFLELAQ